MLLTVFRKTRMRETAEVERAHAALAGCAGSSAAETLARLSAFTGDQFATGDLTPEI